MVSVVLDGQDIYTVIPIVMEKSTVHTVHGSKHHHQHHNHHHGPHDVPASLRYIFSFNSRSFRLI